MTEYDSGIALNNNEIILIYPPLVKTGLNGPPLGVQHLSSFLRAHNFSSTVYDTNILYCRELTTDHSVDTALSNCSKRSPRFVKLSSLKKISQEERLRFPRSFDAIHFDTDYRDSIASDEISTQQIDYFLKSETFSNLAFALKKIPHAVGISVLSYSQIAFAVAIAKYTKTLGIPTIV
ncbi:MAG: hypothetical protein WAT68_05695, partial [Candidatus Nitrotoga sp.]